MSTPVQHKEAAELALFVKAMRANCFFASIDPVEGKLQYGRDQDRFTGWKLAREAAAVEPSPALVQPEPPARNWIGAWNAMMSATADLPGDWTDRVRASVRELIALAGVQPQAEPVAVMNYDGVIEVTSSTPITPGTRLYLGAAPVAQAEHIAFYSEAIDDIESWASYASEYFQKKHKLAGMLKIHRDRLAAMKGTA